MNLEKIEQIYYKNYKKLLLIPIILLILSFGVIGFHYLKYGDFIKKDVSLKGGITATIYSQQVINTNELQDFLNEKFPKADISVRKLSGIIRGEQTGITIEASDISSEELTAAIESKIGMKLTQDNYSVEEMGSSLGSSFYKQMLIAVLLAFVLMGIVAVITFRCFIPSVTVIFAAFADMVITLAIIDLTGIKISAGGIAAFLMLIGYSVDTDILSATHMIKRKEGSLFQRILHSFRTGVTMTIAAIVAVSIGYFVTNSLVLKQIFIILMIGLFMDIISTWLGNAGILMWYTSRKEKHETK